MLRTALQRCKTQLLAQASMCFGWASCFPSHDLEGLLSFTLAHFFEFCEPQNMELWQQRKFAFGHYVERLFWSTVYLQTCSPKNTNMMFTMSEVQLCPKTLRSHLRYFLHLFVYKKNWQCCKRQIEHQGYFCFFRAGSVCPSNMQHAFQQPGACAT